MRADHTGVVWLIIVVNISEWSGEADERSLKGLMERSLMGSGETRQARALLGYRITPQSPSGGSTDGMKSRSTLDLLHPDLRWRRLNSSENRFMSYVRKTEVT